MKRNFLAITLLASASIFSLSAQKNASNKTLTLTSETDSISYAYGVSTAKQGLNQYLEQLGILLNTDNIKTSYSDKIKAATTNIEKQQLEKDLKVNLDSINTANASNLKYFIEGMKARLTTDTYPSAYYSGMEIAGQLKRVSEQFSSEILDENTSLNMNAVVMGVTDVLQNEPEQISNPQGLIEAKMATVKGREDEKTKQEYATKIAEGEKFMSEISLRDGIIKLPSGILYSIDKEGHGAIPTANDRVKVHYTGRLTNGTIFDSSVDRGEPITFGVSQVIPGWTQILQQMPVGSKWTIYIPYELAYGGNGAGDKIEPFSNLIFEIELLEIEK